MRKNRKKADTYRFNGHPFLHPKSIHSVDIEELQSRILQLKAKLKDRNDPDDKRWTARWLARYEKELAKKQKGLELKKQQSRRRARRPLIPDPSPPMGRGEKSGEHP